MLPWLVNAWVWVATILTVLFGFLYVAIVFLVTAPFDPGRYRAGRAFRHLGVFATWINPLWRFRTIGTHPGDPRHPYIVVSNHESFVDILLISHLPWEMKWLSKKEMFKIPVGGWLMRMAKDIPLDRKDKASAARAMELCAERLGQNVSVMIFPEGTRSTTGDLLPFKDGAFRLAIETGVPVLPLAVHGAATALQKSHYKEVPLDQFKEQFKASKYYSAADWRRIRPCSRIICAFCARPMIMPSASGLPGSAPPPASTGSAICGASTAGGASLTSIESARAKASSAALWAAVSASASPPLPFPPLGFFS